VNHLTEPDEKFFEYDESPLPRKYTAHAGALLPLSGDDDEDATYISPNVLFQMQQDFQQLNFGVYVANGRWWVVCGTATATRLLHWLGCSREYLSSVTATILRFRKLRNASAGSHEFSLGLQFTCRPKTKRFRAIKCPSF
jgi:hypothetical protein